MILAGDVGGTKTALALFGREAHPPRPVVERTYSSAEFPGLDAVVDAFVSDTGTDVGGVVAACFGVAGPVVDQRVATPNLPWVIGARDLQSVTGLGRVVLINDLAATGHGIATLPADALVTLNAGHPRPAANAALIAAGTGLGEALLLPEAGGYRPVPGEGGHCDFGPRDELEFALLSFLRQQYSRVSYERVVSGPGLFEIYKFLRERGGQGDEPAWLAERLRTEDPSAVVSTVALAQDNAICEAALDLFVSLYGAEAGNLVLKLMAIGGLYIGGGIAPKIRARLEDGTFLTAFSDKGRFSEMMARVPVKLILEPKTALFGAARRAQLEADRLEQTA